MKALARTIAEAIATDISDRRGLSHEWEQIDDDVMVDIYAEWERLIGEIIAASPEHPEAGAGDVSDIDLVYLDGEQLWLWKNGDHYLAFAHEYPCYEPGGDPMTLGEPAATAIFKHSHDRSDRAPSTVDTSNSCVRNTHLYHSDPDHGE